MLLSLEALTVDNRILQCLDKENCGFEQVQAGLYFGNQPPGKVSIRRVKVQPKDTVRKTIICH